MAILEGKKIARVATVPFAIATQANRQISHIVESGADVILITSAGPELNRIKFGPELRHIEIEIPRALAPFKDLIALIKLVALFRRENFDIVHSTTPKAGLLCAIAGKLARVPVRLHTFTGQTWITLTGPMRTFAQLADRAIGKFCSHCFADAPSQMEFLIANNIISEKKISVIGSGSLAGINLKRFNSDLFSLKNQSNTRDELNIAKSADILIFVGRVCRDKGVFELLEAFERLSTPNRQIELLLVGPLDSKPGDETEMLAKKIAGMPNVHHLGYVEHPEKYLAIAQFLCLPSYREGFGTVVLEAAAMHLPTVGTDIYGLSDAIIDGKTGILVPPRDQQALSTALAFLVDQPDMRAKMGRAAHERCIAEFDDRQVSRDLINEYRKLLEVF